MGELKLEGLDVALGGDPGHRLSAAGVTVTVIPDIVVRGVGRTGPFVGAMKFRYVKTKPITEAWAGYSATILHQFVEGRLTTDETAVERRHCRYVDVFAGKTYEAPVSFKERRREIEAACLEIKGLWPTIQAGGDSGR